MAPAITHVILPVVPSRAARKPAYAFATLFSASWRLLSSATPLHTLQYLSIGTAKTCTNSTCSS